MLRREMCCCNWSALTLSNGIGDFSIRPSVNHCSCSRRLAFFACVQKVAPQPAELKASECHERIEISIISFGSRGGCQVQSGVLAHAGQGIIACPGQGDRCVPWPDDVSTLIKISVESASQKPVSITIDPCSAAMRSFARGADISHSTTIELNEALCCRDPSAIPSGFDRTQNPQSKTCLHFNSPFQSRAALASTAAIIQLMSWLCQAGWQI